MYKHFKRIGLLVASGLLTLSAAMGSVTKPVQAQAAAVTLSARAVLPADSFIDGPASGAALAGRKVINGIPVPFSSQPVGSFTGIAGGDYKGYWAMLNGSGFDNRANSADYLLRGIVLQIDWRKSDGSGSGAVNISDWPNFSDPRKLISSPIKNSGDPARILTGGDFTLRGLVRSPDKSLWTIDTDGVVLHFATNGTLLEAPHPLPGIAAGTVQDLSLTPDGQTLLVATRSGGGVMLQRYSLAGAPTGSPLSYPLDAAGLQTRGWVLINAHQALVIEQDSNQNAAAKIKRIYLADLSNAPNNTVSKTLVADLLKIADPANLGTDKSFGATNGQYGLKPFVFPYQAIDAVYPVDANTLIVVNNNHFPLQTGRDPSKAAYTEFIQLTLPTALDVQLKDTQQ